MRKGLLFVFLVAVFVSGNAAEKITYGWLEVVYVQPGQQKLIAKLDTGAKTSSIYAQRIELFDKHGQRWVRFVVPKTRYAAAIPYSLPLYSFAKIKRKPVINTLLRYDTRPVVTMKVRLGKQEKDVLVNLSNRHGFDYPMLLGREALIKFNGMVDPDKKFIAPQSP